jgi:Sec-independent protein translocase protein TatA
MSLWGPLPLDNAHAKNLATAILDLACAIRESKKELSQDDQHRLGATLAKAKSLARRMRRLAASMGRLDDQTAPPGAQQKETQCP